MASQVRSEKVWWVAAAASLPAVAYPATATLVLAAAGSAAASLTAAVTVAETRRGARRAASIAVCVLVLLGVPALCAALAWPATSNPSDVAPVWLAAGLAAALFAPAAVSLPDASTPEALALAGSAVMWVVSQVWADPAGQLAWLTAAVAAAAAASALRRTSETTAGSTPGPAATRTEDG